MGLGLGLGLGSPVAAASCNSALPPSSCPRTKTFGIGRPCERWWLVRAVSEGRVRE